MNYSNIIKETKKYHFLYVTKKGVVLLSSSNNLKEAKQNVTDKLKPKIDKYIGKVVVRLQLNKIEKKLWDISEKKTALEKITSFGGPIEIYIDYFVVTETGKLIPNKNHTKYSQDKVYVTKSFLETKSITNKHLKIIAKKAVMQVLRKSLLKVCTLENI